MNAFLTGSQVYGTPTERSDVDLCVQMSWADMNLLTRFADSISGSLPDSQKFGKLNLLILEDWKWRAWKRGTEELVARKPVTREEAIAVLEREEKVEKGLNDAGEK